MDKRNPPSLFISGPTQVSTETDRSHTIRIIYFFSFATKKSYFSFFPPISVSSLFSNKNKVSRTVSVLLTTPRMKKRRVNGYTVNRYYHKFSEFRAHLWYHCALFNDVHHLHNLFFFFFFSIISSSCNLKGVLIQ